MKKDLVVLVADKNMEATVRTLLEKRHQALCIRQVQADIFVHPRRDPGVLREADNFLRGFCEKYHYALVMFDYEGCGQENQSPNQLEADVKKLLENAGWAGRCEVIVLVPELEIWVWSNSPHLPAVLGLKPKEMQSILARYSKNSLGKPKRPKEAMEECLRQSKVPRSSSIYAELAEKVSLQHCSEPSFVKFRSVLQKWFPKIPCKSGD